ncbi:MAG: hypothetical protein KAT91_01010 [Candidatus Aenigmarchaeota archaeon]|nr:hypothetical protein [Candidatus Aenigmarchaeota archaeon]
MVNWNLLPNEKKIHLTKMSRVVFLKAYLISFALILIGIVLLFLPLGSFKYIIFILFLGASAIPALLVENKRKREMVLITTERVLIRKKSSNPESKGTIQEETILFDKITNVQVRQTKKQRMLKMGDVIFKIPGEEHTITDIHDPHAIERAVYKILNIEKQRGIIK